MAGVLDHEREVGQRRRVGRAAGTRAHDGRNLGDEAAGLGVALEYLREADQRIDALLDAGPARVVEADDGHAVLDGLVHHLADLLGDDLADRPAQHREVVGEEEHLPAVDVAVAGDDGVAGERLVRHPEVGRPVLDEGVDLVEGPVVDEEVDALARGHLALLVLGLDTCLAAAELGFLPSLAEFLDGALLLALVFGFFLFAHVTTPCRR